MLGFACRGTDAGDDREGKRGCNKGKVVGALSELEEGWGL